MTLIGSTLAVVLWAWAEGVKYCPGAERALYDQDAGEIVPNPLPVGPPRIAKGYLKACQCPGVDPGPCLDAFGVPLSTDALPPWRLCGIGSVVNEPRRAHKTTIDVEGEPRDVAVRTRFEFDRVDPLLEESDFKITTHTRVDVDWMRELIDSAVRTSIPSSDCNERYSVLGSAIRTANRSIKGTFDVRAEYWWCCLKCVPCLDDGSVGMCDASGRVATKDVGVDVSVRPTVDDGVMSVDLTVSLDERGGMPPELNFARDLLNIFGTGATVENAYREGIKAAAEALGALNRTLLRQKIVPESVRAFEAKVTEADFVTNRSGLELSLTASTRIPSGAACAAWRAADDYNGHPPRR